MYDGLFKIIPALAGGTLRSEAFNVRMEELYLLDLCFLAGTPRPTLATLHEDSKHQRYLKTHEVAVRDKALSDGPWPQVDCSMCLCVSPHPVLLPRGSTALGGPAHVSGRRLPSRRRRRSSSRCPSEACSLG